MRTTRRKATIRGALALTTAALLTGIATSVPATADDTSRYERTALRSAFDFVNKNEFGRRSSVSSILKKKDVHSVAVTFIASFMDVPRDTVKELDALNEHYRKRGVVLIVSIEPSYGSKPIKNMLDEEGIKVPVSFTGKQWDPFQKVAGSKHHNSWPWTFYIDKEGNFVSKMSGVPYKHELEKIALPGDSQDVQDPGVISNGGGAADALVQPPNKTLSEITVPRPEEGDWKFADGGGFGDSLALVLPASGDAEPKPSAFGTSTFGTGSGAFGFLGSNDAVVHVSTLDRRSHTSVGRTMVDPGSAGSILDALEAIYEEKADKLSRVRQSKNSKLGGQRAGKITATLHRGDSLVEVTAYAIPVRVHTYIVTVAHGPDLSEPATKQIAEVLKGIRFQRG